MSHKEINQSSGSFDYYTPTEILDLVRKVLGHVTLDPASCEDANRTVQANHYYTIDNDGLKNPWYGKVFLNPPFHRGEKACKKKCKKKKCKPGKKNRGYHITKDIPSTGEWTNKAIEEYEQGNIEEAIVVTFSSMSEGWMKNFLPCLQCFPTGRIHYRRPDGKKGSATKGTLITYIGSNGDKFKEIFSVMGHVK